MELFFLAILVLSMAFALGSGYPVAFALPGSAILTVVLAALSGWLFAGSTDAFFHSGGPAQWLSAGVTNLRGVYWEVERDTLIAIPLFIFMGIMLQRSKIAEDLLVCMAQLFGPVPGGLGISVVFVGALLAATTGIVGATVVAMGLISLPAMLRNGYSPSLATGTIAASGTLGQIIPPSIVLIILADQLASASDQASTARKALHKAATGELSMPSTFDVASTSAGEMFLGAFVPGIVLVLLYMIYILIFAMLRPASAPSVPYDGKRDGRFWINVALTLIPPLTLIFMVLGSIITGVATVNQAGAIGAAGALVMAGYRLTQGKQLAFAPAILAIVALLVIVFSLMTFDMNIKSIIATDGDMTGIYVGGTASFLLVVALVWSGARALRIENTLHEVMIETAKTTSLVFIILLGAAMLTAVFRAFGGEELVRDFLNSLPGGFWTQFIIVMAVIFVLGFFLDFIEIAVVVVPIVAPILLADPGANITAVWLGVMIGLNIQTSFLTPPFGFALFYLRGVAPASVRTIAMYKGVVPFIGLQLMALAIVGYWPQLVNYLPNRLSLTSEAAPPPRNPRLQHCLEEYVFDRYAEEGDSIRGAIATMQSANLDLLPKDLRGDLEKSLTLAEDSFARMAAIKDAEAAVREGADAFRPIQQNVRALERQMAQLTKDIDLFSTRMGRMDPDHPARENLANDIDRLTGEREVLAGMIPTEWETVNRDFKVLTKAEQDARNQYRRNVDGAYEPLIIIESVLADTDALAGVRDAVATISDDIAGLDSEAAMDLIKEREDLLGAIAGTSDIKSTLSKARRALKGRKADPEKAQALLADAINAYDTDMAWRKDAAAGLSPALASYHEAIRGTIGIRMQEKMTREQALYVAACRSGHRDISLGF